MRSADQSHWLIMHYQKVSRGFEFQAEARKGFPPFLGTRNILEFRGGDGITLEALDTLVQVWVRVEKKWN